MSLVPRPWLHVEVAGRKKWPPRCGVGDGPPVDPWSARGADMEPSSQRRKRIVGSGAGRKYLLSA